MSDHQKRTLSDWLMVGTLLLTLAGYAVHLEGRISKLEQKFDDLAAFVKSK